MSYNFRASTLNYKPLSLEEQLESLSMISDNDEEYEPGMDDEGDDNEGDDEEYDDEQENKQPEELLLLTDENDMEV